MQSFSKSMQGHARSLGAVGLGMTAAFTAPLVGIAQKAFSLAADFEQSMNVMAAAGDIPAAAMAKLEAQALSLGATTVFSAGDVADAMLELTKSGMAFDQVGESIQGVTELAAAGDIALGEAASVTSQYLNSFSLEAGKAGEVANLLAGGANASAAEVYDMAKGGVQAAGAFADMGLSVSDLVTSLAILANRGQDASKGGTNLNQMMQDLAQPTIKARKEMKRLGIDLFDVNGEFIGLIPTIEEFNEATAGMTMEQREVALGMIFSGEGLRAMRPLLETTGAGFANLQGEIEAEGQAASLAQARMKGLAGGMEYLSGSVDSFLIGTAKPFLNFFNEIVIGVADAITGIGDLPDPIKNAALAFGAVLAAAGPLIGVAAAVAFALSALGTAAAPILLVVGAVAALAAGIAALDTMGVIDLGAMWDTVTTKVGSAIAAVQSLATEIAAIATTGTGEFTVGPLTVQWSPENKTIDLNTYFLDSVITWTPERKTLSIDSYFGDAVLFWEPERKTLRLDTYFVDTFVKWTPEAKTLRIDTYFVDTIVTWTAEQKSLDINTFFGNTSLTVTPEFTAFNLGESLGLTITSSGMIEVKLGAEQFNFDLSAAISTMQIKIASFAGEVQSAWQTEGWSGLGTLATEKITQLGTDIGTAFGSMVTLAQLGLVLATGQVATEINKHFGEGATIDMSSVGAWAQRQADAAKAKLDEVFGEGNLGSTMITRVQDTIGRITETMAGFGEMTGVEQFDSGVRSILEVFGLIKGLNLDAITGVTTGLTTLATGLLDFSTKMVSGLNATKLAEMLGGIATEVSGAIKKAFAPEKLTELGTSIGGVATTIISKLGELLAAPEFGTNVGTAMGEAVAAIAAGAAALVQGIADKLGEPGVWDTAVTQIGTFVSGFVSGVATGLQGQDWSAVAQAIVNGIGAAIVAPLKAIIDNPLGLLGLTASDITEAMPETGGFGRRGPAPGAALQTGVEVIGMTPAPGLPPLSIIGDLQKVEGITEPQPLPIIPTIAVDVPDFEAVPLPVVPTLPPVGSISDIVRGQYGAGVPVPVTPAFTIPFEVPPFDPIPVPATLDFSNATSVADILRPLGTGGGADTALSVRVTAESVTAAAGMTPLQTDAIIAHVEQPSPIPTINVKANITNPGDLKADGSGLANAGAAAGAAISSSLSGFKWPGYPPFEWPPFLPFEWPGYPPFEFPPIPRPSWISELRVPRPSWLGEMLTWSPTVTLALGGAPTVPGALAGGTSNWRGGVAIVGEEGRELVTLPKGSSVRNHRDTEAILAGAGGGVTVTFTGPITIASDSDLDRLADKLVYKITQRQVRRG